MSKSASVCSRLYLIPNPADWHPPRRLPLLYGCTSSFSPILFSSCPLRCFPQAVRITWSWILSIFKQVLISVGDPLCHQPFFKVKTNVQVWNKGSYYRSGLYLTVNGLRLRHAGPYHAAATADVVTVLLVQQTCSFNRCLLLCDTSRQLFLKNTDAHKPKFMIQNRQSDSKVRLKNCY